MIDFDPLEDKAVLITGAADGIGLALAETFAAGGARVFLADIAADKVAQQAERLGASSAACDVTDAAAVEAMVEKAWQEVGPIDLLCGNAGVFQPGSLLDASSEDIAFQFDVNVWGILNACRPFVRKLRQAGRPGHVLMTGSEHSLSNPGYLRELPIQVYNMTKHCVLAMADVLRRELEADDIGVSVLCPGPVVSGLGDNSVAFRPERYGSAPAATDPLADGAISEPVARRIAGMYLQASDAAALAIAGLRRGLFVIPTHSYILADATERFREIQRGFEVLEHSAGEESQ
ncbi:MAG: SDR family oxidoreductase [Myxococcota bacterium]|nr:SDR family oxidoreductase [Myxococcota bacterium]